MMPRLEDLPLSARLTLGIIAALVAAIILMVVEAEGEPAPIGLSPHEETFTALERQALDQAYVNHMMKLFNIWVTDYSDAPPRAIKGAQNLRSAYTRALAAIEKREKAIEDATQKIPRSR
jgi:hypothetical protein